MTVLQSVASTVSCDHPLDDPNGVQLGLLQGLIIILLGLITLCTLFFIGLAMLIAIRLLVLWHRLYEEDESEHPYPSASTPERELNAQIERDEEWISNQLQFENHDANGPLE